nr:hypothetical protein [Tanacetum cinerariifolium]
MCEELKEEILVEIQDMLVEYVSRVALPAKQKQSKSVFSSHLMLRARGLTKPTRFKSTKKERAKIARGLTSEPNLPWVGMTLRSNNYIPTFRKRETVGSQIVQQTGIQYFNCKGFGHTAKECRSAKRVKDSTYQKEKMLLCKQEDTREVNPSTNEDTRPIYDNKLLEKLHSDDVYNVFTNERLNPKQPESINDTYVVEKVDSNITHDSSDISNNKGEVDQDDEKYQDKRVLLSSLIENMKLEIDERKKIKKNVLCLLH